MLTNYVNYVNILKYEEVFYEGFRANIKSEKGNLFLLGENR